EPGRGHRLEPTEDGLPHHLEVQHAHAPLLHRTVLVVALRLPPGPGGEPFLFDALGAAPSRARSLPAGLARARADRCTVCTWSKLARVARVAEHQILHLLQNHDWASG